MKVTESKVKENWDKIWQEHSSSGAVEFLEKLYYRLIPMQFGSKTVYKTLNGLISENKFNDFSIIECGCGSGYIQKAIYKNYNCDTYFLDISKDALDYAASNLREVSDKSKIHFIEMSALDMNLKNNNFDVVWNAGVIEHFNKEDQKKMISEMLRITKKGGLLVFFTPSIYGKIYLRMKERAERLGIWQAGYEKPISTIKDLLDEDYKDHLKEYSKGGVTQLHYLKYYFKNKYLRYLASFFLEIIQYLLSPFEFLPGYYLISIIEKK